MSKYIDAEKLKDEIVSLKEKSERRPHVTPLEGFECMGKVKLCKELLSIIDSLQQEQPKKRLIQVKCLYPYDESWQKNKVYTCEVWHHGDLNHDFWDVYYDYGKDPRYVQFPSIELLNEEFVVIQEQPEVDLVAELKHYLATTPKEQLEKEWKELEPWGNIGPTVQEFLYGKHPEVDLEKEIEEWWQNWVSPPRNEYAVFNKEEFINIVRHFYELGLNARKEE